MLWYQRSGRRILPTINNAISGPCVCADYVEQECGNEPNCEWYAEGDSCRTSVWVECQNNPDCRLIVHVDHHYERNEKPQKKVKAQQQQDSEYDWPYVCSSGQMLKNVISVQTNILAARQRAKAMIIENNNGKIPLSMGMIITIIALVTFIVLAGCTVLFKKKNKKMPSQEPILSNEQSTASYATFF